MMFTSKRSTILHLTCCRVYMLQAIRQLRWENASEMARRTGIAGLIQKVFKIL
ncbi:hypothetical protein EMCG_04589 [[Emmonsia] crescens]|uniref:Uncharacterized protein n=1 Tax=[Emmonsia] crescens TaxID=73230 RepID=A0A0G2J7A8_9EURO|nr:hypothetical protein EMCG_04589 [Emmonsia crescens UAMH 3008]